MPSFTTLYDYVPSVFTGVTPEQERARRAVTEFKDGACPEYVMRDVADAVVHLVEENAMNYGFILSKCTSGAVELLRAVAAERVGPEPMSAEFGRRHGLRAASSVRFALDSLLEDELLYKRDDGYVVYDRLFAEWLRK